MLKMHLFSLIQKFRREGLPLSLSEHTLATLPQAHISPAAAAASRRTIFILKLIISPLHSTAPPATTVAASEELESEKLKYNLKHNNVAPSSKVLMAVQM